MFGKKTMYVSLIDMRDRKNLLSPNNITRKTFYQDRANSNKLSRIIIYDKYLRSFLDNNFNVPFKNFSSKYYKKKVKQQQKK